MIERFRKIDSSASGDAMKDGEATFRREHFIPISRHDLSELLPDYCDLDSTLQQQFHEVCLLLDALMHQRYHHRLNRLLQIYAHLDPDHTLIKTSEVSALLRDSLTDQFFEELKFLLEKGNYRRLDEKEIGKAVEAASQLGIRLQVDFDVFNRLEVYARGNANESWTRRSWQKLFRKVDFDVAVFRTLVLVFRLREHARLKNHKENIDFVYIKTFKNIPHSDLDVLLPGTTVKMSLMDRSKIIVPTLSGVAINLFKAWRTFVLVTIFASVYNFIGMLGLIIAIGIYLVKLVFGLIRAQDKYRLNLTQHLYFQNLDNNRGGLFRILSEAEEQEFREVAIAYFYLWQHACDGLTSEGLDQECEAMLRDITSDDVDFEVDDALSKLLDLEIINVDQQGRYRALPPEEAIAKLDQIWDDFAVSSRFAARS
jgi:hypothetical protein